MKLFLLSLIAVCLAQFAKAQTPTITNFNGSSGTVCSGSLATFTATIGNATGIYTYTLTNGSSPLSGIASTSTFSQTVTTSGTGSQTFTLTISNNGISTSATTTLTVGSHPDYQPLVDLYNSTNGPGWNFRIGWLNGCDPCTGNNGRPWYGITCTNGRVTRLSLDNNQLTGTLPANLGSLTNLQQLYLNNNQLTGSIPGSLSTLTNIQQLSFSNNQLSGCFPASLSALCVGGRIITMSNNPGLPGTGNFAGFCVTGAGSDVNLVAIGTAIASQSAVCIGNPVSLSASDVRNNPSAFYSWLAPAGTALGVPATTSVVSATLTATGPKNFTVLITNSGSCTQIATVSVKGIASPSPTLISSPNEPLSCSQTSLTLTATGGMIGEIYSYAFARNNELVRAPSTSNTLSVTSTGIYSVTTTHPAGCSSSARISVTSSDHPDLRPLTDLYNFTFGPYWRNRDGWLTSCDPCRGNNGNPWFGIDCTGGRVSHIYLSNNLLSGTLPNSLSALSNLQLLSLVNNFIKGELPASLGTLTSLKTLYLNDNQIGGEVPSSFSALTNLESLSLNRNRFIGLLPICLSNLTNLKYLGLQSNYFNGPIPPFIGSLKNLKSLLLNRNLLEGPIPDNLSSLTELTYLTLSQNFLTGQIPTNLSRNLQYLSLANNKFTGGIPESLSLLSNLSLLYLDGNRLNGKIPESIVSLTNLEEVYLSYNQLEGNIPASFSVLTNLRILSLAVNQLTGSIPSELGSLKNLQYLGLHSNYLSGCLPVSLSNLCGGSRDIYLENNPNLPLNGNFAAFCANGTGSDSYISTATATPLRPNLNDVVSLSASSSPGISYTWTAPTGAMLSTPNTAAVVSATMTTPGLLTFTVVSNGGTCVPPMTVSVVAGAPCGSPASTTGLGQPLTITGVRVIDCANGSFQILTTGGTGQPINFTGIVGLRNTDPYNCLRTVDGEDLVRAINTPTSDVGPFNLQAVQVDGGLTNTFAFDLKGYCTTTTNPPSIPTNPPSSTTTTPPSPTPTDCGSPTSTLGQSLSITGVTDMRCLTGSFRILTSGGNGQPINFAGIVGLSNVFPYNCIRTVDGPDLVQGINNPASDASPFLLRGIQVGGAISPVFVFDFKQYCASLARLATPESPLLEVRVLGNPTPDERLAVEIRNAAGNMLHLRVLNEQGQLISEASINKESSIDQQTIILGRTVGMYFLQVTTPTQSKTIKIVHQ